MIRWFRVWARRRELWNRELRRRAQRQFEIQWLEHNLRVMGRSDNGGD